MLFLFRKLESCVKGSEKIFNTKNVRANLWKLLICRGPDWSEINMFHSIEEKIKFKWAICFVELLFLSPSKWELLNLLNWLSIKESGYQSKQQTVSWTLTCPAKSRFKRPFTQDRCAKAQPFVRDQEKSSGSLSVRSFGASSKWNIYNQLYERS